MSEIKWGVVFENMFIILVVGIAVFFIVEKIFVVSIAIETNDLDRAGIAYAEMLTSSPEGLVLVEDGVAYKGIIDKSKLPAAGIGVRRCSAVFSLYYPTYEFSVYYNESGRVGTELPLIPICGESFNKEVTSFPVAIKDGNVVKAGTIYIRVLMP